MATLYVDPYRPALLLFIDGLDLGTFKVSTNLPWIENRAPLYFNNKKTIYVDNPNSSQTPVSDFLNQDGVVEETTTVSIYFVTDAKKLPAEYDDVVNKIKSARTMPFIGVISKTCNVTTTFVEDDMLTTFEFSFKKIITN